MCLELSGIIVISCLSQGGRGNVWLCLHPVVTINTIIIIIIIICISTHHSFSASHFASVLPIAHGSQSLVAMVSPETAEHISYNPYNYNVSPYHLLRETWATQSLGTQGWWLNGHCFRLLIGRLWVWIPAPPRCYRWVLEQDPQLLCCILSQLEVALVQGFSWMSHPKATVVCS